MGGVGLVIDGVETPAGGPKQRLALAILALSPGRMIDTDRLIDLVWDEAPPPTARRTLQSYIAALRRIVGSGGALRPAPGGYVFDVDRADVDLLAFEDDVTHALDHVVAEPDAALELLDHALGTWQQPLAGVPSSPRVQALIAPFEELRLQAIEGRHDALLGCGQPSRAAQLLEPLVRGLPTREVFWLQLARAQAMLGRRDTALATLQRAREALREELGVDPSDRLREIELRLLSDERLATIADTTAGHGREVALPSGEVTFVFTDIEGSTKLLRRLGDDYDAVLERHRAILRSAWLEHGGHEFGTEGDSFFVAFADPNSAVQASIDAQRGLAEGGWPPGSSVRVRIGIHCGMATPRRGNYVALGVHQAARVMAGARGDQTIVSADVASKLHGSAERSLAPLGRFQVRDFDDPVELFAIDAGTSDLFLSPPRLVPAHGHNLSAPGDGFFGRVEELGQIASLARPGGLVTLIGPGGVGKTRLAIEAGLDVAATYPDGVWMVQLGALEDSDASANLSIVDALADVLGVLVDADDRWQAVLDHLRGRTALLIIDNCEHVLEGCRSMVSEMHHACPDVAVLATSRERLGLKHERLVSLRPLTTRTAGPEPAAAVQLFIDRDPLAQTRPADGHDHLADIEALCDELDGLPLAIELAAARAANMSPRDMLEALSGGASTTSALATSDPSVPGRHRTLARMLDWSYDLLTGLEQSALRRLSVFASSFDVETATAAIADDEIAAPVVAELIWSLDNKSLIVREPVGGTSRYRLLRTVRTYAGSRLDADERAAAGRRLMRWFDASLGPDQVLGGQWVGDVRAEFNNLQALTLMELGPDRRLQQKLVWTIGRYLDVTGNAAAGIAEVQAELARPGSDSSERVALLTLLADLHLRRRELGAADELVTAAESLAERVGVPRWDDAGVMRTRGEWANRSGHPDEAARVAVRALSGALSPRGQARMLNLLGLSRTEMDDLDGAISAFQQEFEVWSDLGLDSFIASTLGNLAETSYRSGRISEAAAHQLACLEVGEALGQRTYQAFTIMMAAKLLFRSERWLEFVRLQAAADAILEAAEYELYESDRAERQQMLDLVIEYEDADNIARVELTGRQLSLSAALEIATSVLRSASTGGVVT
jgi:predicted ATPase/class 3 adenylate cyclase